MNNILFVQFFPYPLLICLIILSLICFLNRRRGVRYLISLIVFGLYILEVINVLFFPFYIQDNWPANITRKEILRTLNDVNLSPLYFLSFSDRPFSLTWVIVDFGLNLLLTIPFGFGIGYLQKPGFLKLCLWAFGAGFSLEALQLILKLGFNNYHVVDINDVILNTLGVFVGYLIYLMTRWIATKKPKSQQTVAS